MRKILLGVLQFFTVSFGLIVAALMLWFPNIEGRNINSTLFEVYFNDPFLAFAYFGSIPFFIGLYQIFNILQNLKESKLICDSTLRSLQIIKYCSIFLMMLGIGVIVFVALSNEDDKLGGYMLGGIITLGSIVVNFVARKITAQIS